jgi:hypothetical protein
MQKLHLVGFTADFDGLIFSARKGAKSGNFVVPLDGRLLKQIAEAERLRGGGPARPDEHRLNSPRLVRPESALNPREMQDRIRSGWTLDEVAAEAGVDLDWVRRFAAPVLAEVGRVVERARDSVYDKPRFGLSSLPLGASVRRNVLDRGVRLLDEDLDDAWTAYQLDEDIWVVRFAYTSRGRLQEAEWLYDVESEELSSRNRLASQLGHVARGRKRSTAPAVSAVPKPSKATAQAAKAASRPATKPVAKPASRPGPKPPTKPPTKAATKRASAAVARPAPKPSTRPASTNGHAPERRPAVRTTPARPAPAGRTPASPRKKAASRPAKKPAKETAAALIEAPTARPAPRPPAREPVVELVRQQDWATDPGMARWTPPEATFEPVPPPASAPVPDAIWDAAAAPIGDMIEPPLPGAADVDPVSGIARIDSRRTSRFVSAPPPRTPVFRGDVARATPHEAPGPRRPRRTEPLRGR